MTTMSGQGAAGNAGPVARLQAELEQVEGELVLARAEAARMTVSRNYYRQRAGEAEGGLRVALSERDEARAERDTARALVPETLVCW